MWEFEFYDEEKNEYPIYFGYNLEDVKRRNPDVDFSKLICVFTEYID